ncbi:MAG TPA: sugar transferase [Dehalococcoidia bacterium]|nr:sugar transferase [Dehalococcoidia bacterium]
MKSQGRVMTQLVQAPKAAGTYEAPANIRSALMDPPIKVDVAAKPHFAYNFLKRVMDIAGALTLLFFVLVPMLAIAVAIKLTSPGPVFFKQRRLGLGGHVFYCLKFRTMVADAEKRQAEVQHLNVTEGPTFKHPADPRITPLGRTLRRWSLDELPQVWNILCGEMSLVGPRSLPVAQNVYAPGQEVRLSVKPGLTCTWQVSGRSTIGFERWMELDAEYVQNRSIAGDVMLVLRTIPAVASGRGAM